MTMATTAQRDRATSTDALVRTRLIAGDTRGALGCVWSAIQAETTAQRKADAANGALWDAALAGWLVQLVAALATQQPRKPPGYRGGPPSAAHLLAAYEIARHRED